MKKLAWISLALSILSIALFVCAIIAFGKTEQTALGSACLSFGFVSLFISIFLSRRAEKQNGGKPE